MKNNATTTKVYTTKTAQGELEQLVSTFNSTEDVKVMAETSAKIAEVCKEYNTASMNETFAKALKATDTHPILALARMFKYKTVSPKTKAETVTVDEDNVKIVNTIELKWGARELDMFAFIDYAVTCKRPVTHSEDWKGEVIKARLEIEKAWKNFFSDEKSKDDKSKDNKFISVSAMKRTLQTALDAIVFVPTENNPDKNALVVTNIMAKRAFAFCNKRESSKELDSFNVTYKICDTREFNKNFFDMVKDMVHEKCYTITYVTETEETATK